MYYLKNNSGMALYKSKVRSWYYLRKYAGKKSNAVILYTCKRFSTALKHREMLYRKYGELFDVYDEEGKVDISKIV
jgi:hypothetical protein